MPSLKSPTLRVSEIKEIKNGTDGHGYIDATVDVDQKYIYFMGSVTPPSTCYAHLHKRN